MVFHLLVIGPFFIALPVNILPPLLDILHVFLPLLLGLLSAKGLRLGTLRVHDGSVLGGAEHSDDVAPLGQLLVSRAQDLNALFATFGNLSLFAV